MQGSLYLCVFEYVEREYIACKVIFLIYCIPSELMAARVGKLGGVTREEVVSYARLCLMYSCFFLCFKCV